MRKRMYFTLTTLSIVTLLACGGKEEKKEGESKEDKKTEETGKTEESSEEPVKEVQPLDSAASMEAWMKYMTPGEMHAMFSKHDGKWDAEVTMWMGPDAPPSTSKASVENKMIMGGRYQESTHKGDFGGMPFEGKSWLAYDNASQKFKSIWIDNFGTGMMMMEGTFDAATNTLNMAGTTYDPSTGGDCKMRETFKIIDENNQMFEMFCTAPDGKEYKNMEIKYTRKK